MQPSERIAIYGGSFDPVHIGHLAVAEAARATLDLDRVLLVPAARQPLKGRVYASSHHRMAMLSLACADHPAFVPDDLELRRPPPSYTADTVVTLREHYGLDAELWLVLGADAAYDLPRWQRISMILAQARVLIVARPGVTLELDHLTARLPALAGRVMLIDGPHLTISSSDLRQRLANNQPVRYLLPEAVRSYILDHGLYRGLDPYVGHSL